MNIRYNISVPSNLLALKDGKTALERVCCFTLLTGVITEVAAVLSI